MVAPGEVEENRGQDVSIMKILAQLEEGRSLNILSRQTLSRCAGHEHSRSDCHGHPTPDLNPTLYVPEQ